MQDAAINSTNTDSYGDGGERRTRQRLDCCQQFGVYEFVVATSAAGAARLRSAEQAQAMVW